MGIPRTMKALYGEDSLTIALLLVGGLNRPGMSGDLLV